MREARRSSSSVVRNMKRRALALAALGGAAWPGVAAAEPPSEPVNGVVRLHVETQEYGVVLYRVPLPSELPDLDPAFRGLGIPVCRAPCDRLVDGREGRVFRFIGPYVYPSFPFKVGDRGGDLTLTVTADGNNRLFPSEPPTKPVPGAPRVHVESPDPDVVLFRQPSPIEEERLGKVYRRLGIPLCHAPCDQVIDGRAGQVFVLGARDVATTPPFLLADDRGNLTLEVRASRYGKHAGPAMLGVGGGLLAVGVPLAVLFLQPDSNARGVAIIGAGVGAAGLALVAGGVALVVKSRASVVVKKPQATLDGGVLHF